MEGSIQTRSYDAQDGSKRYVTEIIAENVESLDKGNADRSTKPDNPPDTNAENEDFTEVEDDELPF